MKRCGTNRAPINASVLAVSKSIRGPWKRMPEPILQPRPGKWDALMTTNPAPCVNEDGSVLLVYKSTGNQQDLLRLGVARAERFDAPFRRLADDSVFSLRQDRRPRRGRLYLARRWTLRIDYERHGGRHLRRTRRRHPCLVGERRGMESLESLQRPTRARCALRTARAGHSYAWNARSCSSKTAGRAASSPPR